MGWRGTLRSLQAAARAAERDAQRRRKAAAKAQVAADARAAVSDWKSDIDALLSIHTNLAKAIDWQTVAETPRPAEPLLKTSRQTKANEALSNFKPSVFDIFRGGAEKHRQRLEEAVREAPDRDRADYEKKIKKYKKKLEEWEAETSLARRLVTGEAAAITEVIQEMQSMSKEGLIGSSISFSIDDGFVHAQPKIHADEVVPNFRRKQLASGRLSQTKMPVGEFNELYQDYVASVALKVAGDLFQILPLDEIYVTCLAHMLNSQTGHHEQTPILSVQFVRPAFSRLNLAHIDPSDSLENFNHVMSFKKTKGFARIEPLSPIG